MNSQYNLLDVFCLKSILIKNCSLNFHRYLRSLRSQAIRYIYSLPNIIKKERTDSIIACILDVLSFFVYEKNNIHHKKKRTSIASFTFILIRIYKLNKCYETTRRFAVGFYSSIATKSKFIYPEAKRISILLGGIFAYIYNFMPYMLSNIRLLCVSHERRNRIKQNNKIQKFRATDLKNIILAQKTKKIIYDLKKEKEEIFKKIRILQLKIKHPETIEERLSIINNKKAVKNYEHRLKTIELKIKSLSIKLKQK